MTDLPSSIEQYLLEAGFTSTEVLVLRRLIEDGEAVTLRELASKTGKSTGVLDGAMKKLLKKKIVVREPVNETIKYQLKSIQPIVEWMEGDKITRQEELERRHQDFETFLSSVKFDQTRPDIEYFDGKEGLMKAYSKLLNEGQELLHYYPVQGREDEDPLRDFRVQFFRERHRRDTLTRVIVPDTQDGKRYRSRDAFEYRTTRILPQGKFPYSFEKVIAGNVVACFHHEQNRACFLRFPELAEAERQAFMQAWDSLKEVSEEKEEKEVRESEQVPEEVAMMTRVVSGLRDFFLSKKSIATIAVLGILAAGLTYGLYKQNEHLNTQRIREQVKAIAATAAPEFDPADLAELRTEADIYKPQYRKVIEQLQAIREHNESITYVYILRPTEQEHIYTFVADADSFDPYAEVDSNHDGTIDEVDALSPPGQVYDNTAEQSVARGLDEPAADIVPTEDQWGRWLSGLAPIKDVEGKTVAILGVDREAEDVERLTEMNPRPLVIFVIIFLFFILVRLLAFNRSLCKEILEVLNLKLKSFLIAIGACAVLAGLVAWGLHVQSLHQMKVRFAERAMSIATTTALSINADDLNMIHDADDMHLDVYQELFRTLNEVRDQNDGVVYIYILRPNEDPTKYEWIVDADTNYYMPLYVDSNADGILDEADENVVPGQLLDSTSISGIIGKDITKPLAPDEFNEDQWGKFITGYAPILDDEGDVVGLLGVDYWASDVEEVAFEYFSPIYYFLAFFVLFIIVRLAAFNRPMWNELMRILKMRAIIYSLVVCGFAAIGVTWLLYLHELDVNTQRIRDKVKAIAATAAPEFSVEDINAIQDWTDYRKPEYAKLIYQLQEIRERNPKIVYAYIMRETKDPFFFEFVVDADSLYLNAVEDLNEDGLDNDYIIPGQLWLDTNPSDSALHRGVEKPAADRIPAKDEWGVWLAGHAPIKDKNGKTVAILGVDMYASDVKSLAKESFSPILVFSALFGLLELLAVAAVLLYRNILGR